MREMNEEVRDELHRLRARAYGPGSDIAADPEALARLAELEDLDRRGCPPIPDATPPAPASTETSVETDMEAAPVASDEPARERGAWRRPIRSRRGLWVWAVSIAVVAALSSAATAVGVGFAPVSRTAGVAQVATLTPDPTRTMPALFGLSGAGSQAHAYADFFGLTAVVASVQSGQGDERNPCLALLPTSAVVGADSGGSAGSYIAAGCGAGAFHATAQFVVAPTMPTELIARFPVGSAVQFVFDGERVGVFSDAG